MEAVITTVGGAILSASFQALFDRLGSSDLLKYVGDEYVVEELKKWKTKLKRIYLVLEDAEERQMSDPSVKMWVSELSDLAYDVEDILDEFSTDLALQRKLEDEPQPSTSKLNRFLPTCCGRLNFGTLKCNADMISRIKRITASLDEIIKQKDDELVLVEGGRRKSNQIRERPATASLVNEAQIYGREKDKEAVMDILMKAGPADAKPSVIPIVGMGGVGKTTLAQLIFNDNSLEFDLRSWVSVGEDFDVHRITKTILDLKGEDENKDLNWHQLRLKEKLSRNKFLIVLDDIWTENYEEWTGLCTPFTAGKHGSTLIITTRSEGVSRRMGTTRAYHLDKLSYDDSMLVFAQHALGANNFDEHRELKEIGTKIVERCQGLPLAAKALGGLLRGNPDRKAWLDVSNSEIWYLQGESNILPALMLSYFHLPSHLKQCFSYCAIFPKDYEFDENELVLLWMAEGFLSDPKKKKSMKALGHDYFRDLLSRSFFQRSGSSESRYMMHDLMNDLARYVSGEICFQLGDNLEDDKQYAMVRHSSFNRCKYDTWQKFEVFQKMKCLRTFLALPITVNFVSSFNYLSSKVLSELVTELKCLRVLSLAGYRFEELPISFEAFKLLRYLNLSYSEIRRFPESVVHLLNLQTLILRGCNELTELPLGICNLENLECLDVSRTDQLRDMPPQIGNLRNLHTLTKFVVGKENGLKLTELKKLCHLEGTLDVEGLQNVVDIGDADFDYLKEKHGLVKLKLKWDSDFSGSRNTSGEVRVLDSLKPHHENLSSLSISGFGGTKLPSWIGDPRFRKMVKLKLRDCRNVSSLPPLGQLGALRELSVEGMNGVKEVSIELYGDGESFFDSLETLSFANMEEWEKWDVNEIRFPKLRELAIVNCRKLVGKLPSSLPSLQRLYVKGCRGTLLRNMCYLTSLTELEMREISGLVSLDEAYMEDLVALQDLTIEKCNELKHLWKDVTNLDKLASLKSIRIRFCEQMVSLEGEEGKLPCNLKVLDIGNCQNLEIIFKSCNLQLECFEIFNVRSIKWPSNVEFPDSLKILKSNEWSTELMKSVSRKLDSANGFSRLTELFIRLDNQSLPHSLQNLISLQSLSISGSRLENLTSLLNSMQNLTSLRSLYIWRCENLMSLPSLTSLRSLRIVECRGLESFPLGFPRNLMEFEVSNCRNLKQPMSEWDLHSLTSLTKLTIGGRNSITEMLESLPLLPTSLTYLSISDFKNLKSISNVKSTSLTYLIIHDCPNLRSLPLEIGFPPTLGYLSISRCPVVNERDLRSLILHIPLVFVNEWFVDRSKSHGGI